MPRVGAAGRCRSPGWTLESAWGHRNELHRDCRSRRNRSNIKNAILAYVPEQMLVIRNIQAPPNFEYAEDFGKTVTVINLRSLSKNRSRVELDGIGFLATPAFDTLLKKFRFGDSWTLEHLKRAAEHGPIDWAEEARSDPPKQSK